ncbi:hypothetical protein HOY80DRAFT_983828 [Tuber brumale]|nr:hypothetical protein HOY80DRAFT_983828 [Tuber brumale]
MAVAIPLIWITAIIVLAFTVIAASVFVKIYQDRHDRDAFVTVVCVLSLTSLLATVCLLPVDIALVSGTTNNATGLKKDWASPEAVAHIILGLKIVYYLLYSLDVVMCFLVIPFAYFWYEEWDVDATTSGRIKGAMKYSFCFLMLVIILLVVGFFLPVARETKGHLDLDYFKKLLLENHGERALTFITGTLLCLGIVPYVFYTAPGLALTPQLLIRSIRGASLPSISASAHQDLLLNRERQRIIEARCAGGPSSRFTAKDRRELEGLQREERSLVRRQRVAEEGTHGTQKWLGKLQAIGRPFEILLGILVLLLSISIFISMLMTSIDKSKNSVCGKSCGYILAKMNIPNPINWLFVATSRVFPIDYILTLILVLDLFIASVVGTAFVGIRFLWVSIFQIRPGHTKPQGLLMATVILTLTVLAVNYSITMIIAPQYAHYGGQKFCNKTILETGVYRDCSGNKEFIIPCSETGPQDICTPTVVSTFLNRVTLNFPYFGAFAFWSQFAFLGVYLITLLTGLVRPPKLGNRETEDEDAENDEDESLLAGASRRVNAAWEDIRGQTGERRNYGTGARVRGGDDA